MGIIALGIKLASIAAIMSILWFGTFVFTPRLKEMFAEFGPDDTPDPDRENAFFALRSRRKWWCGRCWQLGVVVLVSSAVLRWS